MVRARDLSLDLPAGFFGDRSARQVGRPRARNTSASLERREPLRLLAMPTSPIIDRLLFSTLWAALIGYWLLFSPPAPSDLLSEIIDLTLARTASVDPIAIAIFNLLGVLPTAFLALLLFDTGRPGPWPFALGSYVLGGVILLPYLALRDTNAPLDPAPGRFVRAIGSRIVGAVLLLIATSLVLFAILTGDPQSFRQQFLNSQFVAVMSVDLLVLTAALHRVAAIDRRRRAIHPAGPVALAYHAPLFGPLLYLALRRTSH